jgi:hypothetical protein
MKSLLKSLFAIALGFFVAFAVIVYAGNAEWLDGEKIRIPFFDTIAQQPTVEVSQATDLLSSACAVKPNASKPDYRRLPALRGSIPLTRFRPNSVLSSSSGYTPREIVTLAHPTNFGRRFLQDINSNPNSNEAVVVLHETVGSRDSTINYFQTPHPYDDDQVSYHSLIAENGTIHYMVPPDRRAFGAGNSLFSSEGVKTNRKLPPSVNNFAYHISLVTPPDGRGNGSSHGGYTKAQYESLAWLVSKTGVPDDRITTHKAVDRSRQRQDPRSFNREYFFSLLSKYSRQPEISMMCTLPAIAHEE